MPSATQFGKPEMDAAVIVEKQPVSIDVAIAGDAIPQVKVLANEIEDILAGMPSCFRAADGRVINLEAPVGERKGLPGDKTILAFASPPAWFAQIEHRLEGVGVRRRQQPRLRSRTGGSRFDRA